MFAKFAVFDKICQMLNGVWSKQDTLYFQGKGAAEREEEEKTGIIPGTEGQCVVLIMSNITI